MRLLSIFFIFTLFVGSACYDKNKDVENHDSLAPLIKKIKKIELAEPYKILEARKPFLELNTTKGYLIAKFYELKYAYYYENYLESLEPLEELYEEMRSCNLTEYQFEIDFLLTKMYGRQSDPKKVANRLRQSLVYLNQPDFALKKVAFIYGSNLFNNLFSANEAKQEILWLLQEEKNMEWSVYHPPIYLALIKYYFTQKDFKKAKSLFDEAIQKTKEINDIRGLAELNLFYAEYANSSGVNIEELDLYIHQSEAYAQQLGNNTLSQTKTIIGHIYHNNDRKVKAVEKYNEALDIFQSINDSVFTSEILGYIGITKFRIDESGNFNEALEYLERAFEFTDPQSFPYKQALERKMWIYQTKGMLEKAKQLEINIADYVIQQNNSFAKEFDLIQLNLFLPLGLKDAKIQELELANELQRVALQRVWFIIGFGALVLILSGSIFYFYKKNINTLKKLKTRQQELKSLNGHLRTKNSFIKDQKKLLESLLMELEKSNQNLGNFAQIAAHDIKSPLRTIHSFASILYTKYSPKVDAADKKLFNFVINSCHKLQELVSGLLRFSEISSTLDEEISEIDVNLIIEKVIFLLSQPIKETKTTFDIQADIPPIFGYQSLVELLFNNLISNSIRHCKPNTPPHISIQFKQIEDNLIQFSISDNGKGISEEFQTEVFQFFKEDMNQNKRLGIGLATCKKIIDRHETKIWLKSTLNKGSTFYFTLPAKVS